MIQHFNGVDILLTTTKEILHSGLSKYKEQKTQVADILESCISTLRILTKDCQPMENFVDSAKHAQNQIRSTQPRFAVILNLFCYNHDFQDKPKIICVSEGSHFSG